MSTDTVLTSGLVSELQKILADAAKGNREPEKMRVACAEMDRLREELRQKIGTVEVAVELIRAGRNE
jgi:hypothetical protein